MPQGSLFLMSDYDLARAKSERDRAVARAARSAAFASAADRAIRAVAASRPTLIVDDIWPHMPDTPTLDDRRAIGSAMLAAVRAGVLAATVDYKPSARVKCHANPRRVWRSRIYSADRLVTVTGID